MVTITADEPLRNLFAGKCGCRYCLEERFYCTQRPNGGVYLHMGVCPQCNNKHCPHAADHKLNCTNSNATGQSGSSYV